MMWQKMCLVFMFCGLFATAAEPIVYQQVPKGGKTLAIKTLSVKKLEPRDAKDLEPRYAVEVTFTAKDVSAKDAAATAEQWRQIVAYIENNSWSQTRRPITVTATASWAEVGSLHGPLPDGKGGTAPGWSGGLLPNLKTVTFGENKLVVEFREVPKADQLKVAAQVLGGFDGQKLHKVEVDLLKALEAAKGQAPRYVFEKADKSVKVVPAK